MSATTSANASCHGSVSHNTAGREKKNTATSGRGPGQARAVVMNWPGSFAGYAAWSDLADRGELTWCTLAAWYQGRPPRIPRPFSRASGTEKPTRILSNTIGVPGVIDPHGSVAGPVT